MTIGTKSSKKLFKRNILKHLINFKILTVITIVCSVFLFFGGPGYYSPRSFKYLWDIGHIVFFCALSTLILLSWSTQKEMSFLRQSVAVVLIAIILGILIEWVQAGTKRTVDILDVVRNLIGTLVAISFLAQANKTVPKLYLRTLQALTIFMVILAVLPFAKAVADEMLARVQFPVLSDFENPFEIDRWSGDSDLSIDHTISFHGQSSLRAVLNTSLYSGVSLKYFPSNWLPYKYLQLSIFNPEEKPIAITCRIHDRRHVKGDQAYDDRYNQKFTLAKGWNLITVPIDRVSNAPKSRKMDLEKIQGLGIFATGLSRPKVLYIDYVQLTDTAK